MEIEFLGTGAGSPSKFRNVSSLVLKLLDENNSVWMFDCGEGTQHQILRTTIGREKLIKFLSLIFTVITFLPSGFSQQSFFSNGRRNASFDDLWSKGDCKLCKGIDAGNADKIVISA